jgi:hypothetical protein
MILSNQPYMEIKMATKKTKAAPVAAPAASATEVTAAQGAPTTTTVETVQLTIADLQLLARIVDLASRRGAFQAGELSQVGDAYNKLSGFLAYVESTQKKEEETKAETSAA